MVELPRGQEHDAPPLMYMYFYVPGSLADAVLDKYLVSALADTHIPAYPTRCVDMYVCYTLECYDIVISSMGYADQVAFDIRSTLKRREYVEMCAAGWDLFRFERPETLGSPGSLRWWPLERLLCIGAVVAASYLRRT